MPPTCDSCKRDIADDTPSIQGINVLYCNIRCAAVAYAADLRILMEEETKDQEPSVEYSIPPWVLPLD